LEITMSDSKKTIDRWWQLIGCVAVMMAMQTAWTPFTVPLTKSLGVKLAAVQIAFTLFILFETWRPLRGLAHRRARRPSRRLRGLLPALVVGVAQAAVLVVTAQFVVDPPCGTLPPGGGP
jgi:hypothetical protein